MPHFGKLPIFAKLGLMTILPLFMLIPLLQTVILMGLGEYQRNKTITVVKLAAGLTFITQVFAMVYIFCHGSQTVFGFRFDHLSSIMLTLISLISLVVQSFSIAYMQAEKFYNRYFCQLSLLIFSLLAFVASDNLWVLAASWVAMSISLVVLFRCQHNFPPAKAAAQLALKSFLIGDVAFLLGVLCLQALGISSLSQLFTAHLPASIFFQSAGFLFAIAALTKTANIPFYRWLPNTMASPTPVSAIMHAGFVNSGGYLLARLSPYYAHFPMPLQLVLVAGVLTSIVGAAAMLVQTDIKRYLAYSTMGQMGFMMMQCGLGAFSAALFHLVAHSLFKSSLFLGSGSVIQKRQKPLSCNNKALVFWLFPLFLLAGCYILNYPLKGMNSFLLIFPMLTMLQTFLGLAGSDIQYKAKIGIALGMGVAIPLLYLVFEYGMVALIGSDVKTLEPIPSFMWPLVMTAFVLGFGIVWLAENRLLGFANPVFNRLYVRLLNLSSKPGGVTIYTHRDAIL